MNRIAGNEAAVMCAPDATARCYITWRKRGNDTAGCRIIQLNLYVSQ
jgi:hypothetical protein